MTSQTMTQSPSKRARVPGSLLAVGLLFSAGVGLASAHPFMGLAAANYFCLCLGLLLRKTSKKGHAAWMTAGIGLDILLVLILQVQRSAVQTAASFTLSPLQQAHIGFSTLATVLYFPTLYLGYKLLKSPKPLPSTRRLHLKIAPLAFFFRTLGFVLMFSLLTKH